MDLVPLRRVSTGMDAVLAFDPVVRLPRARCWGIGASVLAHAAVLYVLALPALYVDQQMPAPRSYSPFCWMPPPPPPPLPLRTVDQLQPQTEPSYGCGSLFAHAPDGGWTLAPTVVRRLREHVSQVMPFYGEVTTARATGSGNATVAITVCVSRFGDVTRAEVVGASGMARWDEDLVEAIARFHHRPCALVDAPAVACTTLRLAYEL